METNVVEGTARVRARPRERALVDDRAVRALRRDAARRATSGWRAIGRAAARAWPTGAARRSGVRIGRATTLEALIIARARSTAGARRSCCRCCGRGTRAGPGRRAVPSTRSSSGTRCCTRIGADGSGRIPGPIPIATRAAQSGLARGLQRPVPHRRRAVLLSADRHRSLQPPPAGLPRPALRQDRRARSRSSARSSARWGCPTPSAPTTARRSPRPAFTAWRR